MSEISMHEIKLTVDSGYLDLAYTLGMALDQAQFGKGKERHANGLPFNQQPMIEIGRMVGSGYTLGQAMKKAQEAHRLPTDRAINECLGAINYLAGTIILLREEQEKGENTLWQSTV